ncbi:MAG: hydroxymethylbilane synthase [Planctomycetales bacterium]|nr:hydroxymethylbilane synthase [Planctomycetales bacterium]
MKKLRLGTRASALARWQAEWVQAELQRRGHEVELVLITTTGDTHIGGLESTGGVGVFTKEIQRALLANEVDIAVHSLKDLPTEPVAGLALAAVPIRAVIEDALISVRFNGLAALPHGGRIGTGSLRRRAQLLHLRPDLRILGIRGNVDTRLSKLDADEYDAIILAHAGLQRLGWDHRVTEVLSTQSMLPAVGQGALGIETRVGDRAAFEAAGALNDRPSHAAVLAERSLLAELRGGCLAPVAAWARPTTNDGLLFEMDAVVLSADGVQRLHVRGTDTIDEVETLGQRLASELIELGASELITSARSSN